MENHPQNIVKTVALVSCVVKKRAVPSLARDLYISPWFKKASAYADAVADIWFILSAKYGLVDINEVIAPYDLTLNKMSASERRALASGVLADLLPIFLSGDVAIFLAGTKYREFLIQPLRSMDVRVEIPMRGLRIGEQMQWLNRHLGVEG